MGTGAAMAGATRNRFRRLAFGASLSLIAPVTALLIAGPRPRRRSGTSSWIDQVASTIAFTEHTFGRGALSKVDRMAYDFASAFDYAQPPLSPARMVTSPVPAASKAFVASHPPDTDDPT
jgi:hypothetical protein